MLRKCGYLILSFAVLSISFSVFFSADSKAWSGNLPTSNCGLDAAQTMQKAEAAFNEHLKDTYETQLYACDTQGRTVLYLTKTSITFHHDNATGNSFVTIAPGSPTTLKYILNSSTGAFIDGAAFPNSTSDASLSSVFSAIGTIYYSTDYIDSGGTTYGGTPQKTKVFPDIDYEVVGKTIKFKYNGQNVPFTPCSANWMITKTNYQPDDFQSNTFLGTLEDAWDGWRDLTGASGANDSNNHVLDFRYKKSVSDQQTYTVDEYGNYYIALGLNTHWEGAPRLDCGDSGDSDNFNYDVKLKVVALKIDGTTYSGTTQGSECGAAGGFCDGFAGANGTNPILKAFQTLTNIQTFGLQAFLLAPINFVASLPSMANTCSPISFPLFGSNIQLQCLKPLYYSWSSTVMTIYTTLINAVVVYAVATKIFETIRNVSAPDKDRIEVVKL